MADAGPRGSFGLSRLTRFLPWTKETPSPNGTAVANGDGQHEEKSAGVGWVGDLSAGRVVYVNGGVPGDVEEVRRETAYAAAAYIYVAIRYRAENVAEPPLRIVDETEDGDEFVEKHPLLELLDEPSPDYDLGELIELTQTYWDIDGDALWVKDANGFGRTGRLTPFSGSEYDVVQTSARIRGRFEVKTSRGPRPFEPEDVVYLSYPNPSDRQRGLSPTDVALHWLNLGKRTTATIKALLQNAMFPSVVITTHPDWSPSEDELQRFKDLIDQYHTSPKNAGKPFVALGGGRVERVSFTLQELVPEKLLDRVETVVSSVFRIPPIVLGHLVGLTNSPWSQMEQAHRQAYSDCIQPLWRRWEKALTRQLLRPVDPTPRRLMRFDTSTVAALQEDESAKIGDAEKAKHWTVNERRVHTGQDPLPDGDPRGEFIELTDAQRFPATPPNTDDEEVEREKAERWAQRCQEAEDLWGEIERHLTAAEERLVDKAAGVDRSWRWGRFDLMTKVQESTWEAGVYAELKVDLDAVLKVVDGAAFQRGWERALPKSGLVHHQGEDRPPVRVLTNESIKAPPSPTGDTAQLRALIASLEKAIDAGRWGRRMTPLVESTAKTALKELAAELELAFSVIEPSLLQYTQDEAGWLVRQITATTREKIASELRAGLEAGESIPDLRKRLQESAGFGRARAELIARTETTRVTNGAQLKAMQDYQVSAPGQVVEKSWLSARDSRVREEHAELDDGSWLAIDKEFGNGLQAPSEPNCRCTLLHRVRED